MTIRETTGADLDSIAVVHARTWQVAYRGLVPDEYLDALDPAAGADRLRSRPQPERTTLLATDAAEPLGFVSFGPDRLYAGRTEIYAIYVLASHWGRGIGRTLLDTVVARHPATEIRLWCAADNARSRRFYETYGFIADGASGAHDIAGVTLQTVSYTLKTSPADVGDEDAAAQKVDLHAGCDEPS